MQYWKKKIKKEFNVDIKKIKLKNEYGIVTCYIAYEAVDEKSIDIINKIFIDPRHIWKFLKMREEINNLPSLKPIRESDVWVEHTLKDFKVKENDNR